MKEAVRNKSAAWKEQKKGKKPQLLAKRKGRKFIRKTEANKKIIHGWQVSEPYGVSEVVWEHRKTQVQVDSFLKGKSYRV